MGKLLNWNFKKHKRYEDYRINKTDVLCRDCKYMEFKNSFDIIQCKNNYPCLNHSKFKARKNE
jgi:hypothetical protein